MHPPMNGLEKRSIYTSINYRVHQTHQLPNEREPFVSRLQIIESGTIAKVSAHMYFLCPSYKDKCLHARSECD